MQDKAWGDQLVLTALSLKYGLRVTILDANALIEHRFRHNYALENVDIVLVHNGRNHYLGACKL